jgi:acyl carrier protein
MTEQITQMLIGEVARMLDIPEKSVSATSNLAELGLDSLQALRLLVQIERTYGVQLPEDDLQNFSTIQQVAQLASAHMRDGATLQETA